MQFTGAFNIDSCTFSLPCTLPFLVAVFAAYIPALEGRAVVSLQMRNFFAAILDLSKAVRVSFHS